MQRRALTRKESLKVAGAGGALLGASTHDVAPTVLGFLGIEPPEPMDGQDLFEGGEPEERAHFSLGYRDFVWTRDEDYVMFAKNDGARARHYDLREDPEMKDDVCGKRPCVVQRMFDNYVLKDAGEPLPDYDV